MKKSILTMSVLALMVVMSIGAKAQQGKWAGLVKYKITWSGNVQQGMPTEWEVKVYNNLAKQIDLSLMGLSKSIYNSDNNTIISCFDFSTLPDEGPTEGMSGKWYIKKKISDEDMKKMNEGTTYTYTGNTKEIAGLQCQEVKVTFKQEDGEEKSETIFVTKEIGPKTDLMNYPGLDAFVMEYPMTVSQDLSAVFTVSELLKGKVKDVDLMLESGYEEVSEEDLTEMLRVIFSAFGGGAADEEDM